jgi:eukaryotic-like serine/threonine-protein kinase
MAAETRRGIGGETLRDSDPAMEDTLHADSGSGASSPSVSGGSVPESEPVRGGMLGRFVLLGELGSGGMGHVYSAYDAHLDRKVAIKLLRTSMRGGVADARARLLREAQAMARINHPNVIKVHEVGTHEDQVYVAMEFADAGTLRDWLARPHSQHEIIDVIVQAGRGLAAAHAAGLVHRDFKPDNVLLSRDGSVRVTDFGLVSLMAHPDTVKTAPEAAPGAAPAQSPDAGAAPTDAAAAHAPIGAAALAPLDVLKTLDATAHPDAARPSARPGALPELGSSSNTPLSRSLTRTGALMGTPQYMAPEQFSGAATSARTDQFAFCVVLYAALYGAPPFPGTSFQELASSVLLGRVSPPPAGARVPGWLRRVLLRGLSADPAARYPSMDALLSELLRERTRRRRRILAWAAGVTVPAAVIAALAVRPGEGAVCAAGEDRVARVWSPARRDQMKAAFLASGRPHAAASFERLTPLLDAWGRAWEVGYRDACEDTRVRREQSDHLLDLRMQCLARRLDEADATLALLAAGGGDAVDHALAAALALPGVAPCGDITALTAPVAPPETELARAQVEAVRGRLDKARGLERLGRYTAALETARAALAAARTTGYRPVIAEALLVAGRNQVELASSDANGALRESMHNAAASGDATGMIDAAGWLVYALTSQGNRHELAHELGAMAEAAATHARPRAEVAVRFQNSLGYNDEVRGKLAEARARYARALALAEQGLGPDHVAALTSLNQLGNLAKLEGRFDDARRLLERVLAARERLVGKNHPDVAHALNNLGNVSRAEGKLDDAKRLYDRALAIRIAALGPDHPDVGAAYNNLGTVYSDLGDTATAERNYAQALALWEKVYGPDNVQIAFAVVNLGTALEARGELDQSAQQYERAIALYDAAHGPDHPDVTAAVMNLGVIRQQQHRLDEAVALFQRATKIAERAHGPDSPDVADTVGNLADAFKDQGKLAEARALTDRSLRIVERTYGADHPRMAMGLINLGDLQVAQGEHAAAIENYRKAAAILEVKLGKDHLYLSYALNGIGGALVGLRRAREGLPLLERALQIRTAAGAPPAQVAEVRETLARALTEDPQTRERAIAEATAAAAEYEQARDAVNAAKVRTWLAARR